MSGQPRPVCSLGPMGPDGLHVSRRPRAGCWRELPCLLDPVDCLAPAVHHSLQCFQQEWVWFGLIPLSGVSQPRPPEHSELMQPLGSEAQTLPLPQPSKTATTRCSAPRELLPIYKGLGKMKCNVSNCLKRTIQLLVVISSLFVTPS